MRKTLVYGTATAAVALTLTGCPLSPVTAVYGPPPGIEEEDPAQQQDVEEPSQTQTEVDEPLEDVYGPPVDLEPTPIEGDEQSVVMVPAVYGPPPEEPEG